MAERHTLLLLRHAQAVDFAPGLTDHQRPLTDEGIEQATAVGNAMRARGVSIDLVLCSSATRTRQTWSALGLDARCELTDEVNNAASDTLLELVRLLDERIGTAMIIGHGPGLPSLAFELAGPGSDQAARDTVSIRYPTATVTEFAVEGAWADVQAARLVWLRLGK